MISLIQDNINFLNLFKKFYDTLDSWGEDKSRYTNPYYGRSFDDEYASYYDDYYGDDYCGWWGMYEEEKKKSKKQKKQKKNRVYWDKDKKKFIDQEDKNDFEDWDDYVRHFTNLDNAEDDNNYPKKKQKKNKKNKKTDNKKSETVLNAPKYIYFYEKLSDKENCKKFYNLKDFDAFIDERNIFVSDFDTKELMTKEVIHCCTTKNSLNEDVLVTDNSYGGLVFSCSEMEQLYAYD